jgi:putative flippase GtrA
MRKLERYLKIISLTVGTMTFGFLAWLMLIYSNFSETTAKIIGGLMILAILFAVSRWGYYFIED